MTIILVHRSAEVQLPYALRCVRGGCTVEVGYPTEAAAVAARSEFTAAMREAFRL